MRLRNSLTSYPVLNNYSDDYIDSSFKCDYSVTSSFDEIVLKVDFLLLNSEIEKLILDGKAHYSIHVECPITGFRKVTHTNEKKIELTYRDKELSKKVEIRSFIILDSDINDFYSNNFNPDYEGMKFNLKKHQIIAIGDAKDIDVVRDDNDLESLPSIIKIEEAPNAKKGDLSVNTDNQDYVLISLSPEVYSVYCRLGNKKMFKNIIFTTVLVPALIVVIQRMKSNAQLSDFHWYKVMNEILEKNNYKLDDLDIDNDTLVKVVQNIFDFPFSKAFKELNSIEEGLS